MLFFRQLELLKCSFQTFFILTAIFCLCQAGVIKKRDTRVNSTSGSITEAHPTILTAVADSDFSAGEVLTTKLQSVVGANFSHENSKELTNNEILINEAKKLLEEEDKIISTNNEANINTKENDSEKFKENEEQSENNIKDIKEIIKNLEYKEQNLSETSKSSAEIGSNGVKEDKLIEKAKKVDKNGEGLNSDQREENTISDKNLLKESESDFVQSFENSLKASSFKPSPSSHILTRMESNVNLNSDKNSVHGENVIEQSEEVEMLKLETKQMADEKVANQKTVFLKNNREIDSHMSENPKSYSEILQGSDNIQKAESKTSNKTKNHEEKAVNQKENFIENLKEIVSLKSETSEQIRPVENMETDLNQKDLSNKVKANFSENSRIFVDNVTTTVSNSEANLSAPKTFNNFHNSIENKEINLNTSATTLTLKSDSDFTPSKSQNARPMETENSSSAKFFTTVKPVVLSIKEGVEEKNETVKNLFLEKENSQNSSFLKEKKPKFINDNSTNAQQLNLPNNPEVWSLAAMKTLPKSNFSLETTQAHTEIFKEYNKEKEEDENKQTTPHHVNLTTMMSNISEKNLLDWSQIMMNKELSTTTRSDEYPLENLNSTLFQTNFKEDNEQTVSTTFATTTLATILSFPNDENNSVADKKVEAKMNNHIELLKETIQETATTTATKSANLLFNATLNTEPNLNEKINLTLKQNSFDESIVSTTTINDTEKPTVNGDEASTIASTITTQTEATAVDMTTVVVEQNSSETTTVSTLGTSKQNTTSRVDDVIQSQQKNKILNIQNENEEESSTISSYTVENVLKENKTKTENNNFNLESIILTSTTVPTTTTVVPITTFRPPILAITSTTSTPASFEQEIDKNGNEIKTNLNENKQVQKQQSILAEATTTATTENNLHDFYNSTKAIETHLEAKQYEYEATTIETITENTKPSTDLGEKETKEENTKAENNTSFFSEEEILSVTTESTEAKLDKTEVTETTPKSDDETTIGSPVVSSIFGHSENERKKEFEIETTTAVALADTTKTPVVVIEKQSNITEIKESSTTTATTNTATTENSVIKTTPKATQQQEGEINAIKEDKETVTENNDNKNEISTTIKPGTEETTKTAEKKTMATAKDEETFINLLDDITTTTYSSTPTIKTIITSPTTTTSTTTPQTLLSTSTTTTASEPPTITTKIKEIYNVIHSTTTEFMQTTTPHLETEIEESSSTTFNPSTDSSSEMIPWATTTTPSSTQMIASSDISKSLPTFTSIMSGNSGNMYPKNTEASNETDVNVIIAITVSVIGVVALILLVGFLYIMRKRQKQTSYSQRCRPVSLDEYTIDNVSVGGSMRKSSAIRSSKRTYGNLAFDDPSLRHNPMGTHELAKFVQEKLRIFEEFRDVPQITSRLDEVPHGCEDKNRYANVLPLPETRVILQRLNNDDKTEYINANYVTVDKFFKEGPKDPPNYYIACQAPLNSTVEDFWRMIWEQQSRVIIQATDLIENGVEKCAEYLPPSVTLDNHSTFGDYQITLQNREVKDKYAISTILLKNVIENATRELTHYWYKWPEVGVPTEEAPIIAMLLEARSSLISYAIEQANEDKEKSSTATLRSAEEGTVPSINGSTTSPVNISNGSSSNGSSGEINGNISMVQLKKTARNQGPLTVHCSPGTGRTGTIIACDIAIRSLETPKRTVDIPQIVYHVRRGRASAVLTKEQYEFIYKVANMYAAKITNPTCYN